MKRLAFAIALAAAPAAAHDGVKHDTADEAARHESVGGPATPLPFELGGAFTLIDQTGAARSEADPEGRMQLLFFGYANCPAICSVALPRMAEMTDLAVAAGHAVRPLLVTVDPARDTPEAMRAALPKWHADMTGLTGDEAALAHVRSLFQVERKLVFEDPEHGPIYAHGSHIYLLDSAGEVLTLIPPIVSPEHGAKIIAKYAAGS